MLVENKIELVTIVTGLVFISGISHLYIFYKCFNITILPFIESDEILVTTFDSILYFIILFLYLLLVVILFYRKNFSDDANVGELRSYRILGLGKIIFLVIGSITLIICNNYLRPNPNNFERGIWCLLLFVGLYVIPIIFFELSYFLQKLNIKIPKINLMLIFSGFSLLIFSIALSLDEANKVKFDRFYVGSSIILKDGTEIKSTSDFTFVGMTKSYLFFYDNVSGRTTIRPNEISKMISK